MFCFILHEIHTHLYAQLTYAVPGTSQTGGQWFSDTSPFSIPFPYTHKVYREDKIEQHTFFKLKRAPLKRFITPLKSFILQQKHLFFKVQKCTFGTLQKRLTKLSSYIIDTFLNSSCVPFQWSLIPRPVGNMIFRDATQCL